MSLATALDAAIHESWQRDHLEREYGLRNAKVEIVDGSDGGLWLVLIVRDRPGLTDFASRCLYRVSNMHLQLRLVFRWLDELVERVRVERDDWPYDDDPPDPL